MPFEKFFYLPNNDHYEGILLNKHKDRFSLIMAQKPRNGGTVYKKWVIPSYKDKPKEKENGGYVTIPLAVRLGNHRDAIRIVLDILAELTNVDSAKLSEIIMELKT